MRELFPTLFLLMAVAGCQKDPTVVGTDTAGAITFEGAVAIAASEAGGEAIEFVWEAEADRIGLISTKDDRTIFENVYYAAFTSTPTARFVSPSADKRVLWENDAEAQNFYAYYPYRSTVVDIAAMPVSIPAEQRVKVGEMPWRKSDFVWYAKCENRRPSDGDISLSFKNVCGVIKCTVTTDLDLVGVESLSLRSMDGATLAFDYGTLDIATGELTVVDGVSDSVCVKFDTPVDFGAEPQ
ncbi:MAG: fimbrillin family protein, partial [Alistipes sp.]|nr:fimbrillin family protein [Alistipes sp.]